MVNSPKVSISFYWSACFLPTLLILALFSCTVPKKFQAGKPFVFKTQVKVDGSLPLSERQGLEKRLLNQIDDSLKVKTVSFAGIRKTIIKPAVFDTNYATRSILFMNALMNSLGYNRAKITWDSSLKVVGKQQRVTVAFTVSPGKNLKIDSVGYALADTTLQRLASREPRNPVLVKGNPYSIQAVAGELERLLELYKNNGYYKISKEDIYAEVDTVIAALINPNLDPFEQLTLLNELKKKRENPTINIVFKLRTKEGSAHLKQYRVGEMSIYPDLVVFEDSTVLRKTDTTIVNGVKVVSTNQNFRPNFLVHNLSMLPGKIYRLREYNRTINTFTQLGAWQQVSIDVIPDDSLGVLNMKVNLYPEKKQSLVVDLEATRNAGDVIATSNLFGIGLNIGLRNRNLFRESVQASTNIRGGIELGTKTRLVQTLLGSISQNVYIPHFVLPFKIKAEENLGSSRTIFNVNMSYTDRRDFFALGSINGSVAYEWSKFSRSQRRRTVWLYSPFNFELVRLVRRPYLDSLIRAVPRLINSFNNGLIISQNLAYRVFMNRGNHLSTLTIGLEESGGLFGLFKYLDQEAGLFRYVKGSVDYRHLIRSAKSDWAFRAFAGYGVPYGLTKNGTREDALPFFKSFFAGGPNSMRAWPVRKLGVGSSKYLDTVQRGALDRFADIQLEGNIEYRFNLATIGALKLKSAFFTDIGNIWDRQPDGTPEQEGSNFTFKHLYRDLAVAAGTSLRFDFDYFLIRFDWAYRIKNPVFAKDNAGWFQDIKFRSGQFQLGIGLPF
ncbi:MAG: BamA/TamA family outer membrane protein [Chitinophagaceae bacterium]